MAIFRGDQSPVAVMWVDAAGVEHPVQQMFLGEHLVWGGFSAVHVEHPALVLVEVLTPIVSAGFDATVFAPPAQVGVIAPEPGVQVSASVSVPAPAVVGVATLAPMIGFGAAVMAPPAVATVIAPVPVVSAAAVVAAPAAFVSVLVLPPAVGGGGGVGAPASVVSVAAQVPQVTAGVSGVVPVATVGVMAPTPGVGVNAPAIVDVPAASVAVAAPVALPVVGLTVSVPVATVGVTAQVPQVGSGGAIVAPVGVVSVLAPVPQVLAPVSASAPASAITVAALAPNVAASAVVNTPTATVTAAAPTPSAGGGRSVTAPAAAVTVTALTPTVTGSARVTPPAATITTQALLPGIGGGARITAPVATVAAQGQTPVVGGGRGVAAPAATATVTAPTPTIGIRATITPPVAAVTVTAHTPEVTAIPPGVEFADDFNRSNGVLGANWTYRNGTTSPQISSNTVGMGGTTDGYYQATWAEECVTATQFVECDIVSSTVQPSGILLRYGASGVGVLLTWVGNNLAISTTTGWAGAGLTNRTGDIASGTTLAGKRLRLTAVGNVYTGYVNGEQKIQWVDTGNIIPTTGRLGGLTVRRQSFNNSGTLDNWAFGDYAIVTGPATAHPMGMNKSGTQSCPTSWVQVTGWATRSGFPSTVITSNALVAADTATVTITGKVTITGGTLPGVAFRIKRNGTVIYTSTQSGTTQTGAAVGVDLQTGDTLTMEAQSSTLSGTPTISAGAANTFLYFD